MAKKIVEKAQPSNDVAARARAIRDRIVRIGVKRSYHIDTARTRISTDDKRADTHQAHLPRQ